MAEGRFGFPSLSDLAPGLRTPWLGLYGDLDKGIPPEQVEDLRGGGGRRRRWRPRWCATPTPTTASTTTTGPTCSTPTAAEDAWRRTLSWFDLYAGPDPAGGPD